MRLKNIILELLFPSKCIVCDTHTPGNKICSACWGNIAFINKPYCSSCSFPSEFENESNAICVICIQKPPAYDKVIKAIALMKYDEHSKKLIHKFKY